MDIRLEISHRPAPRNGYENEPQQMLESHACWWLSFHESILTVARLMLSVKNRQLMILEEAILGQLLTQPQDHECCHDFLFHFPPAIMEMEVRKEIVSTQT